MLNEAGALIGRHRAARYALMRDEAGEPFANQACGRFRGPGAIAGRALRRELRADAIDPHLRSQSRRPVRRGARGPRARERDRLPANAGLEALVATADGALIVGAEGGARTTTPTLACAARCATRRRAAARAIRSSSAFRSPGSIVCRTAVSSRSNAFTRPSSARAARIPALSAASMQHARDGRQE